MTGLPKPTPPAPKPSPDIHVLRPVPDPQGLPDHAAEGRRRVAMQLLDRSRDAIRCKDDLLEIADWIVLGPEDES